MTHHEIGLEIAARVWDWIQSQKQLDLVPWISDPASGRYDKEKVIAHNASRGMLNTLEQLIKNWSSELQGT